MVVDLLIIGAGPYGLAAGAYAKSRGLTYRQFGRPLELWKTGMPKGMILRSDRTWHMDPLEIHTYERFLAETYPNEAHPDTIPLERFIEYGEWFQRAAGLDIDKRYILSLEKESIFFRAELEDGEEVLARNVLVAVGYQAFAYVPEELSDILANVSHSHSSKHRDFGPFAGKTVLIIGGRQAAYEYAALLSEQSPSAKVHISHRKATPSFTRSDWSFVDSVIDNTLHVKGWFQSLTSQEKKALVTRFYDEGRLKLEPWLAARISRPDISIHPFSELRNAKPTKEGRIAATIFSASKSTTEIEVDHILLATGFKADLSQIAFLTKKQMINQVQVQEGFPLLDPYMQSNLPGLFFTGYSAIRSLGPSFGFVKGSLVSARLVVDRVCEVVKETASCLGSM